METKQRRRKKIKRYRYFGLVRVNGLLVKDEWYFKTSASSPSVALMKLYMVYKNMYNLDNSDDVELYRVYLADLDDKRKGETFI